MKGLVSTAFQYLAYLGYRATAGLAAALPLSACERFGHFAGTLAWRFATPYRELARRNLRIAFDGELAPEAIAALTRKHFQALGRNTALSFKFASMSAGEIETRVTYEGHEHIEQAAARGRGVIAAIAHLGPWELFAQLPSLGRGVAPATMYRALTNRFINAHVVAQRGRIGVKLFDRSTGFYGPLKHLRDGGGIGILIDQHAGDLGIWCPFFGRLSSTTNLPALLSLRTGAPVVSIAILPDGPGRWRVVYQPPHVPEEPVRQLARRAAELTERLNRDLESAIRLAPEEWFWVHDRWKTPKPHFLLNETRRGMCLPEDRPLKPFRLLLRSPNPLGDACMALPAVRAIRQTRPDLHLTVLCRENLAPIWENCAEIDAVVTTPRDASPRATGLRLRESGPYDAAILFPNSLRAALEAWHGQIPRRVGFRGHWRRLLLDQIVPPPPVGPPRHHAHSYLRLAEHAGADITEEMARVDHPETSTREKLPSPGDYLPRLGICPGAEYGAAKRWPEDRFAHVANRVRETRHCHVALYGSPNERPIGESLAALIEGQCENLVGETTLAGLVDALKSCDVLLTNDTGTMHLAAMMGVPTVAIFGSTEPLWTRPLGGGHRVIRQHVECSPCFLRECPIDFRCMREIDPQRAVEAVIELLPHH